MTSSVTRIFRNVRLTLRFGTVDEATKEKLAAASITELDEIGERLVTAQTLREALGEL